MDNFSSWQNPPINPWPEEQRAIGIGEANFLFNSLFLLLQMPWKLVDIIEQLLHTKTQLQLQFLYRRWWLYSNRLQMLKVSVQFSSTAQLCPNLWDPMNCSKPGLPVHHQLPVFTETHVHWVGDAIQPSHLLSPPSLPAFNVSQHQGLFK